MQEYSIFRRSTLFVSNLKKSKEFYLEVFLFKIYRELIVDLAKVPLLPLKTDNKNSKAKLTILKSTNNQDAMIGLMEVFDPPLQKPDHDMRKLGIGSVAIVISTKNAEKSLNLIKKMGGEIIMPIEKGRNIGDESGNFIPAKVFMARDPDGYFLEIFEVM